MIIVVSIALCLIVGVVLFLQHPQFGKIARGNRRQRILASPHYRDGAFRNRGNVSMFTTGMNQLKLFRYFLFAPNIRVRPEMEIPSVKQDLKTMSTKQNSLVWFGHSSYLLRIDSKTILVDPVLSGKISPVPVVAGSFPGSDVYRSDELPDIDVLLITHDHWDHLDYKTVRELRPRVGRVICSLGVGEHLEHWGYDPSMITELDWWEDVEVAPGYRFQALPAQHFSGRTMHRAQSLWSAFLLQSPSMKLILGGDSGYGAHFAEIGERVGPVDLALLECGQYDTHWQNIHMLPEQTIQAAFDLKATRLMPVHWAKFTLAKHPWDEPILRASAEAALREMPLLTPRIGEVVNLQDYNSTAWWKGLQ